MAPVQFGNYQIVRKIGAGGMAQVFEAQRLGLEGFSRRVALKCILPEMTRDRHFVEMFINEARLGSQLHHPNIIEIQDFNKVNDIYYIAMEMVEGVDLSQVISYFRDKGDEFPPGLAIEVLLQTLEGLGYAHGAKNDEGEPMNIIHRDIKPSNILLTCRGNVKIADFGIAKAATNAYHTRTAEVTKGSLAYMAPEQITRETGVSPASDLFSLGAVLFEMLSLRALFDGENMPSIMFKVAQVEIERDLSELRAVHPQFVPILEQALAKDSQIRFQRAAEMAEELKSIRGDFPSGPPIMEIANELISRGPTSSGDDSIGEQTSAFLGFAASNPFPSMPNLAGGSNPLLPTGYPAGQSNPAFVGTQLLATSSFPGASPHSREALAPVATAPHAPAKSYHQVLTVVLTAMIVGLVGTGIAMKVGFFAGNASVVITSNPQGAEILLNNQRQTHMVGGRSIPMVTPSRVTLPSEGPVTLTLKLSGYLPHTEQLSYLRGEEAVFDATLEPELLLGDLEINSEPAGATIFLSGVKLEGVTPLTLEKLTANKRYEIRLELIGHAPNGGWVEVKPNARAPYSGVLAPIAVPVTAPAVRAPITHGGGSGGSTERPTTRSPAGPPGTLVVSTVPPDSVIFVDGIRRGNAPVSLEIPPGSHRVKIEKFNGTVAKDFSVTVESGKEATRVWDLDASQFISE